MSGVDWFEERYLAMYYALHGEETPTPEPDVPEVTS